jgi:hypothetical protein
MNEYRIRSTGQIVTETEFRLSYPDVSLPGVLDRNTMNDYDADPVLNSPMPEAGLYQTVTRDGAVQDILGNWMQLWVLSDWDQLTIDEYLTTIRAEMWDQIKNIRTNKILEGGVFSDSKWFSTDIVSRSQYLRLKNKADLLASSGAPGSTILAANNANVLWKTMDGSFVTVTIDLINNLMNALDDREAAIFAHAEIFKSLVDISNNPASININLGWPTSFGE